MFQDKKSMMKGQVSEYAKKKFEEGNANVSQYLAQVKAAMTEQLAGGPLPKVEELKQT